MLLRKRATLGLNAPWMGSVVAALILAGCGPDGSPQITLVPPHEDPHATCVTPCGVSAFEFTEPCARLNAAEDVFLDVFSEKFPGADICTALQGVRIYSVASLPKGVGGRYTPALRRVELLAGTTGFEEGYMHEMLHALDHAVSGITDHTGWIERGFPALIELGYERIRTK